eukprot:362767-Chlamydomonas_euryale.AAC.1
MLVSTGATCASTYVREARDTGCKQLGYTAGHSSNSSSNIAAAAGLKRQRARDGQEGQWARRRVPLQLVECFGVSWEPQGRLPAARAAAFALHRSLSGQS